MDVPPRPPAPPRSYTETVEEDVQAATSSELPLSRTRANLTGDATDTLAAGHRESTSGGPSIATLHTAGYMWSSKDVGQPHRLSPPSRAPVPVSSNSAGFLRATGLPAQGPARAGQSVGAVPRAVSSLNLLVRDGPDSSDDEADFASDASAKGSLPRPCMSLTQSRSTRTSRSASVLHR